MKRTIKNILALAAICLMWSCEKAEVPVYNSPTAINFLAPDGYGGFKDDYLNLSVEINLYEQYLKTMDVNESELQIGFQIEGLIPETDMRVRFSTEAVEDYEQAQVELPTDTVIRAGQYKQTATIKCLKPAEMEKAYATYITFDYANSDVVAGTKERQKFKVTVKDKTDWDGMYVTGEDEWNEYYSDVLGKYGPMKVRFVLYALGQQGLSYSSIGYKYYYTPYYPSYGLSPYLDYLKETLDIYNASHGKPLTEPDGTPVSFN